MTAEHWTGTLPLAEAFRTFDAANPHVYRELERLAEQWRKKHPHRRCGMKAMWERLRWELDVTTDDEPFALNNNLTAFYARKLMQHRADLAGLFETRGRDGRCECSECAGPQLRLVA